MATDVHGPSAELPVPGVGEVTFQRTLKWHHTLIFAFAAAGGLFISLGFSFLGLGVLGAAILWGISSLIGGLQAYIFAELAAMFPNKAGGVAMYTHEAWKKYCTPVGVLAAFGYWFGWSITLSITAITVGSLIESTWFPGSVWSTDVGFVTISTTGLMGAAIIVLVWLFNVVGIKPAVWFGYITGSLLILPIGALAVAPFTQDWSLSQVDSTIPSMATFDGWKTVLVWLFVMGWTSYGAELCAAFAPEYISRRHATKALRVSAFMGLAVFIILPLGLGGLVAQSDIAADPSGFYVLAFTALFGSSVVAKIVIACLIGNLVLGMNAGTAAAGRSLYELAKDGMTIKQFGELSDRGVPARAMTLDMIVNIILIFTLASPVAIILAANLGYLLAMALGLSALLLLRRDRPMWPRPIRLSRPWLYIAVFLMVLNFVFIIFGIVFSESTGYGGPKNVAVGVGVLVISLVLFVFRKVVQDDGPFVLREPAAELPTDEEMLLLGDEFADDEVRA